MIGTPALINPLRWIDKTDINNSFDGNYAIKQLRRDQSKRCYFQKFTTSMRLIQQVIADTLPDPIQFVNEKGVLVDQADWALNPLILTGLPDLRIYQLDYSFAGLPVGYYSLRFNNFESEPINVQVSHPNTTLIKYKHSENNYDVVFDTNIEFQLLVEAYINGYSPKNDRNTFNDQPQNLTQLSSVAYRNFKLYVGDPWPVPLWMLDKINQISQCDQVSYDNVYYTPLNEAEFEVEVNPQNNYIYGSLDIQPSDNNNFLKYKTQPNPSGATFKPMQKVVKLVNVASNQTISSVFTTDSFLRQVIVYKSGADFTLNLGTTPGGIDIGQILVDKNDGDEYEVTFPFDGTTTVYLSGTGINADRIYLVYDQLDEPDVPIGGGSVTVNPLGKGATIIYDTLKGDLELDFDLSTGLGDTNRKYKGWAISGSNGTTVRDDAYAIGWNRLDALAIGTETGANSKTISKANLPHERLGMYVGDVATGTNVPDGKQPLARARALGTQSLNYEMAKGSGEPILGGTEYMGDATPFDVRPKSIISVYITKIED